MKKIFTLVTCMFMMASVMAKDYTGLITIDLGMGDPTEQDATISLTNESEKYTLTLVDFSFSGLPLGDISISDLENTATEEGTVTLTYDGNIKTNLGELPGTIDLSVNNEDVMTATITISVMGMSIVVTFDSSTTTTGITKVSTTDSESSVIEIYNLQGQKVTDTNRPGIYILRKADGTATKRYVR